MRVNFGVCAPGGRAVRTGADRYCARAHGHGLLHASSVHFQIKCAVETKSISAQGIHATDGRRQLSRHASACACTSTGFKDHHAADIQRQQCAAANGRFQGAARRDGGGVNQRPAAAGINDAGGKYTRDDQARAAECQRHRAARDDRGGVSGNRQRIAIRIFQCNPADTGDVASRGIEGQLGCHLK